MAQREESELRKAVRYFELMLSQGLEPRNAILRAAATYGVAPRVLMAAIEEVRSGD